MREFRVALTGDFLNAAGRVAYGDAGLPLFAEQPHIKPHFLMEQAPSASDPAYWERFYSLEVTAEQIADIDGLIVLRPWVKRSAFRNGIQRLVVIGRSGAGYDKLDIEACTDNDVAVFNAPLALNHPTASAALLLMLALAKNLMAQQRITRAAQWDRQADVMGSELEGRTLGIVGLGHSGRELARLVAPFRMRLLAYSPHANAAQAAAAGVELTSMERVFRESDFVSVHARLTAESHGMIGSAQFALMKPGAYFVNIARGELVDEPALVEALRSRRIAGAGLDVFEEEPLPAGHPLLALDNVIVTPHWLASTRDVWDATARAMAAGILRASRGLVPEDVVNRQVLERAGFQSKLARFRPGAIGEP